MLQVNMLISWVIKWFISLKSHWHTIGNLAHRKWAILNWRNQHLCWIISNQGIQKIITLTLESIRTIPFEVGISYYKIPECRQHTSNRVMSSNITVIKNLHASWDHVNQIPVCCQCEWWKSSWIWASVSQSEQGGWKPENFIMWNLSDVHITGTTITLADTSSSTSHQL